MTFNYVSGSMPIDEFTSVHDSDGNTKVQFKDNRISFIAGGEEILDVRSSRVDISAPVNLGGMLAGSFQERDSAEPIVDGFTTMNSNTIIDFRDGNSVYLTLTEDDGIITVHPSSLTPGAEYTIVLQQDSTGGRATLLDTKAHTDVTADGIWGTGDFINVPTATDTFLFPNAKAVLSSAANAIDVITCKCVIVTIDGSSVARLVSTITKDFR